MGLAMLFLVLRPGLKRVREKFEQERVGTFANMDDVALGCMGITANTVGAFAFLLRKLDDIGMDNGQPRQDRRPTTERTRPDGRGDFAPEKH